MSVPVESAFAVPSEIGDNKGMVARLIFQRAGVPRDVLEARNGSGGSFDGYCGSFHPTKPRRYAALNLKGVYLQTENQRYYPEARTGCAMWSDSWIWMRRVWAELSTRWTARFAARVKKIVVMADARQRWFDGGAAQKDKAQRCSDH